MSKNLITHEIDQIFKKFSYHGKKKNTHIKTNKLYIKNLLKTNY